VLEQRDGKLNVSSLAAVTAAQKLGGSVTGLVAGSGTKAVAEETAKVKGLEKIIFVDSGAYDKVCILLNFKAVLLWFLVHLRQPYNQPRPEFISVLQFCPSFKY
jgi:electron transfer flavoprotein alpha subunit